MATTPDGAGAQVAARRLIQAIDDAKAYAAGHDVRAWHIELEMKKIMNEAFAEMRNPMLMLRPGAGAAMKLLSLMAADSDVDMRSIFEHDAPVSAPKLLCSAAEFSKIDGVVMADRDVVMMVGVDEHGPTFHLEQVATQLERPASVLFLDVTGSIERRTPLVERLEARGYTFWAGLGGHAAFLDGDLESFTQAVMQEADALGTQINGIFRARLQSTGLHTPSSHGGIAGMIRKGHFEVPDGACWVDPSCGGRTFGFCPDACAFMAGLPSMYTGLREALWPDVYILPASKCPKAFGLLMAQQIGPVMRGDYGPLTDPDTQGKLGKAMATQLGVDVPDAAPQAAPLVARMEPNTPGQWLDVPIEPVAAPEETETGSPMVAAPGADAATLGFDPDGSAPLPAAALPPGTVVGNPFPSLPAPREFTAEGVSLGFGTYVRIHGLVSRPELNGRLGQVCAREPNENGRWAVRVERLGVKDPGFQRVLVRPQNVAPVLAAADGAQSAFVGFLPLSEGRHAIQLFVVDGDLQLTGSDRFKLWFDIAGGHGTMGADATQQSWSEQVRAQRDELIEAAVLQGFRLHYRSGGQACFVDGDFPSFVATIRHAAAAKGIWLGNIFRMRELMLTVPMTDAVILGMLRDGDLMLPPGSTFRPLSPADRAIGVEQYGLSMVRGSTTFAPLRPRKHAAGAA